jgi:GNAT superfamily N-acetyltransferase
MSGGDWFAPLELRELTIDSAPAACELSIEAGWNQTIEDWWFMIQNGGAAGLFSVEGALKATALTVPFEGKFAWISMILVTEAWRRRGLASNLMRMCIERLAEAGSTPILDATEAGRKVYLSLGFLDLYELDRMANEQVDSRIVSGEVASNCDVVEMTEGDLDEVTDWDKHRFGADRRPVLKNLFSRSRRFACLLRDTDRELRGYLLGRDGRIATQIGPVVARETECARQLVGYALDRVNGCVLIDAPLIHDDFMAMLRGIGFSRQRGFTRMALGRDRPFDRPEEIFAIAGPELG